MTRPTVRLRDVAAAAGTSTKTASRVVNGDPRVSADTRARVETAVRELGYSPDPLARSLRLGTDDVIGVVIDSIADPFFASVTGEIERVALDRGLTVSVASTLRHPERERKIIESVTRRRVAGLIVAPVAADHAYLASAPFPVLFVDRRAGNLDADAVVVDDRGAARTAVAHLIAHGHRRIAFVGDHLTVATGQDRLAGYQDALAEAGIPRTPEYVLPVCPEIADAARTTGQLLDLAEPPTAIFSANTRCSLGVVPVLHSRRRTDLAMVGFGDFFMADALEPGVTVIDHPPELIGRVAAAHLFTRLDGNPGPRVTISPPLHLIPRGSGELAP
ncbi:MAG TPA: LacI family DNA-binding transcriptional regulator [Mycobacteriales bacterium]|nr:LacI family DNA-binding transcriptional regulator [Mycobacteriales bacterium]